MTDTPLLLALDCATSGCSAAVVEGGETLALDAREMARGQAEVLLGIVEGVLQAAGRTPQDLTAVAVTRGPGAFTGMRIGLSAARAYALALGVPCIGVTTLEAVAANVPEDERKDRKILAVIESKREDLYVQLFSPDLTPLGEPQAAAGQEIAALVGNSAVLAVGDGAARAKDMTAEHGVELTLSGAPVLPDARIIAHIAAQRLNDTSADMPPAPLYLRPPDAKLPKNQGRARP